MSSGLFNVGSYQVAGHPFLTGSTLDVANFVNVNSQTKISFPSVTKTITIINTSTGSVSLRVHFNSLENNPNVIPNRHYITLTGSNTSLTMNVKSKEIYISLNSASLGNGKFEMFAELTHISANEMYPLTGSGLTL